jgi:hypothetical protein
LIELFNIKTWFKWTCHKAWLGRDRLMYPTHQDMVTGNNTLHILSSWNWTLYLSSNFWSQAMISKRQHLHNY